MEAKRAQSPWRFRFAGGFYVERPDGVSLAMPTRKVAGLLAILVWHQGRKVHRGVLQEALWPNTTEEKGNQSLRKALSMLRQVVGTNVIGFEAEYVQWLPTEYTCDALTEEVDPETMLPEMTEPWFDQLRYRQEKVAAPEAPISAFETLVDWASDHDPVRAIEMMRVANDMASHLNPEHMRRVVSRAMRHLNGNPRLLGWGHYYLGLCDCYDLRLQSSMENFSRAKEIAAAVQDSELLSGALSFDASNAIVLGRASSIIPKLNDAIQYMTLHEGMAHVPRLLHGLATAYVHSDEYGLGIENLEDSVARMPEHATQDRAILHALIALYHATWRQHKVALSKLEVSRGIVSPESHWRLFGIHELTQGLIASAKWDLDLAEHHFKRILKSEESYFGGFSLYAIEGLATVAHQRGHLEARREFIQKSRQIRLDQRMVYTSWDQARMSDMLTSA